MGESVQLNCRNFKCDFNDKGKCRLERITLQDDGSPIISQVICIEAVRTSYEEMNNDYQLQVSRVSGKDAGPRTDKRKPTTEPVDLETAWGISKEDLPEQEPKNHFAQKDEELL